MFQKEFLSPKKSIPQRGPTKKQIHPTHSLKARHCNSQTIVALTRKKQIMTRKNNRGISEISGAPKILCALNTSGLKPNSPPEGNEPSQINFAALTHHSPILLQKTLRQKTTSHRTPQCLHNSITLSDRTRHLHTITQNTNQKTMQVDYERRRRHSRIFAIITLHQKQLCRQALTIKLSA